jgi:hypothetical protein
MIIVKSNIPAVACNDIPENYTPTSSTNQPN